MYSVLWTLAFIGAPSIVNAAPDDMLITKFEWSFVDYTWRSEDHKKQYTENGDYDLTKIILIDVDHAPDGRTFVTAEKNKGVPVTLATISQVMGKGGPLLTPYPNWDYYEQKDICQGIINVYRITIDNCNRLWVLDNGWIGQNHTCPAKLLAFDLRTDHEVVRHIFDDDVARGKNGVSLLVTPIIETSRRCYSVTVYIADALGHGLVIFKNGTTIRLEGDVYAPEEGNTKASIAGDVLSLAGGVTGMALSPRKDKKRTLFFRPLSSLSIYAADTKELKNSFSGGTVNYTRGTNILPSPAIAMAFSPYNGVLFYGLPNQTSIGCYNMKNTLEPKNLGIVLTDTKRLQFVSGMKVKRRRRNLPKSDYLLMMTNRYKKFASGTMNFKKINFRVVVAHVYGLIRNTSCLVNV